MKKIKSIIMATVAACLLFGFSSCGGEKANPAKDFVTLEINGEIFISSYKSNTPTIVIPSKIKGKPVTTISDGAFNEMTFITSVKLPQGIKKLGKSAFNGCKGLVSVSIPEGITEIGDNTFNNCEKLESINIPSTVKTIGMNAFKKCASLKEIVIPEGVEKISEGAFIDCSSLNKLTLPSTLTYTGLKAFYNTSDLDILMPASASFSLTQMNKNLNIKIVGNYTTEQITQIGKTIKLIQKDLSVSLDMTDAIGTGEIEKDAFERTNLIKILLPKGIKKINEEAFYRCENLKEVSLPDGLVEIGEWAFDNSGITDVIIPESVTTIGDYAFYCCEAITSISIPDSVITIGECAFDNCLSLSNVTIGKGVSKMASGVFGACENLTNMVIPANVKVIESSAFGSCINLSDVIIEDGVEEISEYAFGGTALSKITLPASVRKIGEQAFDTKYLETVNYRGSRNQLKYARNAFSTNNINFDYTGE